MVGTGVLGITSPVAWVGESVCVVVVVVVVMVRQGWPSEPIRSLVVHSPHLLRSELPVLSQPPPSYPPI